MQISAKFILASKSPRRRALLEQLGLSFSVQPSPAREIVREKTSPDEIVDMLARRKATPVAAEHPTALTLAADTVVALDDTVFNKPTSEDDAVEMLSTLSGTSHTVYTGIALIHPTSDRQVSAVEATTVHLAELSDEEIEAYVATGSPMDKAGGYGIQDHTGPLFVEGIDGDYYNVVGLPLRRLYVTLCAEFEDLILK